MNSNPDHDLALVESALHLHARALGETSRLDRPSSVVSPCLVVITGKPACRARAEPSALHLVLRPAPDSGWRSESTCRGTRDRSVQIDLVTSIPERTADNVINLRTTLRCADRPPGAHVAGRHAARTAALHRIGEVDRGLSDRQKLDADRIIRFGMPERHEGPAASNLASLWTLLTMAEATVPLHPLYPPAPCLRRLHVFDDIQKGMTCTVTTEVFRGGAQSPGTQSIRSSIRRVADGATLAVCETLLR